MKTFLEILLRMSAYGSIAVLLVLVLRVLLRKLPKKAVVLLWLVAAIRLVCPLNFETPVSLLNLAPQSVLSRLDPALTADGQVSSAEDTPLEDMGAGVQDHDGISEISGQDGTIGFSLTTGSVADDPGTGDITITLDPADSSHRIAVGDVAPDGALSETATGDTGVSVSGIVFIVWILGAAAVVIYVTVGFMRTNRIVARLFRRSGRYLESERISTPFVYGIFSPKICVPASLDVSEKDYMLLHEQIHVKNHDALIKAFAIVVLCLHWFNPLVWVAVRLCMSDLEMRCDEEVVDILGERIRKDYCLSIVNHATEDSGLRAFTTAFAKKSISRMEIKMRIKNLINYKKVSKLTTLTVLIIALAATLILTSCAESPTPGETPEAETPAGEKTELVLGKNDGIISLSVEGEATTPGYSKSYTVEAGVEDPSSVEVSGEQGIGDDPAKTYIVITDGDGKVTKYVHIEKEDGTVALQNAETNEIVEEGELAYSVTIGPDGEMVSSSEPITVRGGEETTTTEGEDAASTTGKGAESVYYEIEEDENGDQRVVVLKYNRLFDDSVHEAIVSDTEKRLTRTCEGAFFGSLDEFKSFYSYSNLNNVLDGVYESYDPRVRVAAWSQFSNEEACKSDIFEEKNNCYVLTRKLDDGSTHFHIVYDCNTHDVTRLENAIIEAEG